MHVGNAHLYFGSSIIDVFATIRYTKVGDTMKLLLEQDLSHQEIEILVRYAKMTNDVERLVSLLQSFDKQIQCIHGNREILITVSDIYYIESVDKKTFVYCEKEVYRSEQRLYQLLDMLSGWGFVQISKSCILNTHVMVSIAPLLNSRMEATLKNGERLCVTRKYLGTIRKVLQQGVEL